MKRRATWALIESRDLTIKELDERIIQQQTEIERLRAELDAVKNGGQPLARQDETFGEYRNRQS